MLGSQLGKFLILILFKQLLSNKIFLGQDKNFNRKSHVGISIGKIFNFNSFYAIIIRQNIFRTKKKIN